MSLIILAGALALAGAPKEIVDAGRAVYNLWRLAYGEMRIICTGTIVSTPAGLRFLSAGHCAEEDTARYYISRAVDPDALIRVKLVGAIFEWPDFDHSIFTIPDGFKGQATPLCQKEPEVGEDVWAWTGPLGILPVLRSGTYSGKLHFPDDPEAEAEVGGMYFVQTNGDGGSSGSGLLRMENGKACIWGIWVGGFVPRIKLDGALGVPLPRFW